MEAVANALTEVEVRVLGCLVEKEATVPDAYPLTGNALRQACNQTTARDPVVAYDDATLQRALDSLKASGIVRFVHPAHGERSTKYRHVLGERLALDPSQVAVLAVLALRGPQTAAELRTRSERLHAFDSVAEVEATLAGLAAREPSLAVALPRAPGQREGRWAHLLGGPVDVDALALAVAVAAAATPTPTPAPVGGGADRLAALEAEVAELRARLDRLEGELGLTAN